MIDLFPPRNVYKETMEGAYGGLLVRFNNRYLDNRSVAQYQENIR